MLSRIMGSTGPSPHFDDTAIDFASMRRDKHERMQASMARDGIEALWILGQGNLRYAIGVGGTPRRRRTQLLTCLVVLAGEEQPHLFTPYPQSAPKDLSQEFIHPPLYLESEAGVTRAMDQIFGLMDGFPRERIGIDLCSPSLFFALQRRLDGDGGPKPEVVDAGRLISELKLFKTAAEIECVRRAQAINEHAMTSIQESLRPGLRQTVLSARFFAQIYDLGATANGIDPIWQPMSPEIAKGPWTTHGDIAFPTCTSDRLLRRGDVLWVDTGIDYHGYQSDFGRTWLVGCDPTSRQLDQAKRWGEILNAVLEEVRPGTTGGDLVRIASESNGGSHPWAEHFYLIHGIGTEPAEQPLIGTDLGDAFDDRIVLAPGMILVLEPSIWDAGHGEYRSEEIVAVTETGYEKLSHYSWG